MNTKSVFTSVVMVGVVGLCLAAQPASANFNREIHSETVKFRDLDLNKAEDAKTLLRRIKRAANIVCTGSSMPDTLYLSSRDTRTCIKQAQGGAVAKLNHPVVTAMYESSRPPVQVATQ